MPWISAAMHEEVAHKYSSLDKAATHVRQQFYLLERRQDRAAAFTSWPFLRFYTPEPRAPMHVCMRLVSMHRTGVHRCIYARVRALEFMYAEGREGWERYSSIVSRNLIGSLLGVTRWSGLRFSFIGIKCDLMFVQFFFLFFFLVISQSHPVDSV